MNRPQYEVPPQLEDLLLEFTVNVLVNQPEDIVEYAVDYFQKLKESKANLTNANAKSPGPSESEESVLSDEEREPRAPPINRFTRRKSVFAEAYNPEDDDEEEGQKVVHPKSDDQRQRLADTVKNIFLFRSLDQEQMQDVLDAMFEMKVQPEEYVIQQGDDGDNFYVIGSGTYNIYVQSDGEVEPRLVGKYDNTGSFGELALMYNMPRAATIQAASDGHLWAMDRQTFRRIVLKNAFKKRKMYEALLENVPMLTALEPYERMNLADALVPKVYDDRALIIKQGDEGDGMYFIESGSARITRTEDNRKEVEIKHVKQGGYFGELALITNKPRAASVYAEGPVRLAFLDREAFERLLGPCMDVMKRNVGNYEEELKRVFGSSISVSDVR